MRIGINWLRYHADQQDMPHMRTMQYGSYTLYENQWANRDFCNELLAHSTPDAIFLLRHHGRSEEKQQMYADPTATGINHAEEWHKDTARIFLPLDRCYLCGINEPNTNHAQWATNEYERSRMRKMLEYPNERAAIWCFGTGHPSTVDLKPENKPDWSWYRTSYEAALRTGNHIGVIHEYGLPDNYMWGDNCNRFQFCPYDGLRFVIQECGIDGGTGDTPGYGWQAYGLEGEQYGSWLQGYFDVMGQDPRIHSAQIFCYDYAHPWDSFDVRPMRDVLERRFAGWSSQTEPDEPDPPPKPIPSGIIDPYVAQAILNIEAGSSGFFPAGNLKIRFEAHSFRDMLDNDQLFHEHFKIADSRPWANPQYYRQSPADPWQEIHTGNPDHEYGALGVADQLDAEAAYQSISMGIAQVMGFNHKRVGYKTARAMYTAFWASEAMHVVAFFNYILSDPELVQAVHAKDWRTIARLYNGAGNVDTYSKLLEDEYNRLVSK